MGTQIGYTTPAEVERLREGKTAVVQGERSDFCTVAVRLGATMASDLAREALEPIIAFTSLPSFAKLPDDFIVTKGSSMAARQLTAGDLRRARAALSTQESSAALAGDGKEAGR